MNESVSCIALKMLVKLLFTVETDEFTIFTKSYVTYILNIEVHIALLMSVSVICNMCLLLLAILSEHFHTYFL